MTREADVAGLVERLRSIEHRGRYEHGGGSATTDGKVTSWGGGKIMELRNPDGPAAADVIERLLAALSAEPVAGAIERVFEEEIAWEQTQSAKRDIGKKAAACHSYAVFALEGARDKVRALSHAAPAGEG